MPRRDIVVSTLTAADPLIYLIHGRGHKRVHSQSQYGELEASTTPDRRWGSEQGQSRMLNPSPEYA